MFEKIRNLYIDEWKFVKTSSIYNKLNNKNILITGSTGLIGTGLVDFLVYINRKLNLNINIWALGRNYNKLNERFLEYIENNEINIITQDITNEINEELKLDYIIHAASNADPMSFSTDPVGTMKANIEGTINLLEYCKVNRSCKLIFVSTSEVYGKVDSYEISESDFGIIDCNTLRACYPESKRVAETLCNVYASQYELEVVIARLCYVYGPTMTSNDSRVIAQFIRNAINNEDIIMKSKGLQERSYCYITDAVTALMYILILGETREAYNISNNKSNTSINMIANILAEQNGLKVIYENPNDIELKGFSTQGNILLNSEKLKLLGWIPNVSLENGLKNTVEILKQVSM